MTGELDEWNRRIIEEFRANAGVVTWSTRSELDDGRPVPPPLPGFDRERGAPIILVSHTGATTGRVRTNPLMYQPVGDGFAVFASYGGSPRPPAWYRNVTTIPQVTVESGDVVVAASARVTHGPERARIWREQVRRIPAFADFERTAGRAVPVVVLEPVSRRAADPPRHR